MGLPVSRPVYKMGFIFSQGVFLGSRSGAAPSASSSFVSSPGFMSWKRRTFDLMMAYHEVLTNVKRRQPLKEVVFDVSVLHFFIVFFKRFYDEYLAFVGVFFTICWSLNLWMIFSLPKRDWKSLRVCGWSKDKDKDFSQAVIGTFCQYHFLKDGRMGRFSVFFLYVEV